MCYNLIVSLGNDKTQTRKHLKKKKIQLQYFIKF